jgi:hypothetical protein
VREQSRKRGRKEEERGRRKREIIKEESGDAAPLYSNNPKNAAIHGGPVQKSKMRRYYIAACVPT